MNWSDSRQYIDRSKPGRLDVNGVEWWATDPYPHWYRMVDNEILTSYEHDTNPDKWPKEGDKKSELYSNCVILDFQASITRAQLDRIKAVIENNFTDFADYVELPPFRQPPICGERDGNSVVPTIAADEC